MRLQGERSVRSGNGVGRVGRNKDNNYMENDNDGIIGEDGGDGGDGGRGRRGSGTDIGNFVSADSGIRRGGNGLIPIPAALDNLIPSSLSLHSLSASVLA